MDCQMPEMDGLEATREIRKRESSISPLPIIAMTANTMAGDREKCYRAGMNDFLPKPVKLEDLTQVLRKWVSPSSSTIPDENDAEPPQAEHTMASPPSPALAPDPAPPLDPAVLADLRRLGGDEDPAFFTSVIDRFCQDSAKHLEAITRAIQGNHRDALIKRAHALKGSARIIGAKPLAALAFRLEQMEDPNILENAQDVFVALQAEYDRVQTALQAALRESATSGS
jgi:CheY-like chemotaxis protein